MKNINLVFETKTLNIARFLKTNTRLIYKEAYTKGNLLNSLNNVIVLDLAIVEPNIAKILKCILKSSIYWYNIKYSSSLGLKNIQELEYNVCKEIIISLNLLK